MKNLSISKKLLSAFGLVLVLLAVILYLSISAISRLNKTIDEFYSHSVMSVMYVDTTNAKIQECAKNLLHATADATHSSKVNEYLSLAEECYNDALEALKSLEECHNGDPKEVTDIETLCEEVWSEYEGFKSAIKNGNEEEALEYYDMHMMPAITSTYNEAHQLREIILQECANDFETAERESMLMKVIIIVMGVIAVVLAMTFALYITKMIVTGLTEVTNAAKRMAEGDFEVTVGYTSQDEVGQLADSIRGLCVRTRSVISDIDYILSELATGNLRVSSKDRSLYIGMFQNILDSLRKFVERLNTVIQKISVSSDQVASGSEQVSIGAQTLSQGSTEQASSIEELAAEISIISDVIKNNADKAAQASANTDNAVSKLTASKAELDSLAEAIKETSDISEDIKKIIKTIEDIAFQTNILALNAAVEAARAGTAGKGFAVVADEVRNLAGKSAEAAKNTTVLIESTVAAIEKASGLASQVVDEMEETVSASSAVLDINNAISKASNEAAESVSQITASVDQISSVVQNNSATAEQSAAASEELSGQSQILRELTAQFQFRVDEY